MSTSVERDGRILGSVPHAARTGPPALTRRGSLKPQAAVTSPSNGPGTPPGAGAAPSSSCERRSSGPRERNGGSRLPRS